MSRCESCGMPLNDATRGTEHDGSHSEVYCATCYADGAFTQPDAGVDAVREASVTALVAQGVTPLTATRLTSGIESLPRWA